MSFPVMGYSESINNITRNFPDMMPISFMDQSGKPTGFETELLNEIVRRSHLNIKENYVGALSTAFEELKNDKTDMVMATVSITPERKQLFIFSQPYLTTNVVTIITKDKEIHQLKDLKNKVVSVWAGTTHEKIIRNIKEDDHDIILKDSVFLAVKDVIQGKSDAAIGDESYMMGFINRYGQYGIFAVQDKDYPKDYYGIAIRKDRKDLKEKIDVAIKEIKNDGTYDQLMKKWYPDN